MHIFGINRSGIHAFAYWLVGHFSRREVLFVRKPTETARLAFAKPRRTKVVMVTHENIHPKYMRQVMRQSRKFSKALPKDKIVTAFLILRDPYNHFASMLARPRYVFPYVDSMKEIDQYKTAASAAERKGKKMQNAIPLWKHYAKEWLRETDYLKCVPVSYNEWFVSLEYRQSLSESCGLEFSDSRLNYIPRPGGGSSFEKKKKRGQNLDVLNRWQVFKDKEWFDQLFDEEIQELSKRIFGDIR
jgi:hypothetical protein